MIMILLLVAVFLDVGSPWLVWEATDIEVCVTELSVVCTDGCPVDVRCSTSVRCGCAAAIGTGKLGYAGCKTVVMSVLIGIFLPPAYLGEVSYGDSGTAIGEDAASVSLNLGEIDETSITSLATWCSVVCSAVSIGNFLLMSVWVVDAYSDAGALVEVRLSGSVLIVSIIVVSATGDVTVTVSSEVCGPIVEDPVCLYFVGVSGCWSSSSTVDATYVGD